MSVQTDFVPSVMEFANALGVDHGPVRRAAAQQRGGNVKRSARLRLFEKPRSLGERRFRHVVEGECHDRFFVFQRNGPRRNMTRQARGNANAQGPMGVPIGERIEINGGIGASIVDDAGGLRSWSARSGAFRIN